MATIQPTFFLSHGGGPWPFMKGYFGNAYDALEASLKALPGQLPQRPDAVLVVTSHWEGQQPLISSGEQPPMIYDYGGFPPHTYSVRYPAPGEPAIARRIAHTLEAAGLPARLDPQRGFDHGTFCLLYPIYPEADMPVVQLSLLESLDARAHLQMGRALAPLREENILILGSGLSFHNLRQFGPGGAAASQAFDGWLQHTLLDLPPAERSAALLNWEQAPSARLAHPREDHLLPLMVALGAAERDPASCVYHEDAFFGALAVSSFRFG